MKSSKINYDRSAIKAGILHFGVGNFHRAHLQCYTNKLLNSSESSDWGICGAMIMDQDESLYNRLKDQQGIYSLTVCGRDGSSEVEWIGSLIELLWSGEDREAIINKVANPDIKIISMTITEGGYNLNTDAVRADLLLPQSPQSIFGIIAEGLRRRIAAGVGGVTILTCDNLQHNGDQCRKVFSSFFKQQDEALALWVEENVSFPNSMVDRITPATTEADAARINSTLDVVDKAPVYCEDYIQWVVEDNFVAGRPAWESVGVEFTNDVAPFEKMKLSLLNAAHTLLSYPSLLSGYRKVDEAMRDEEIVRFTRAYMDLDATPYVPAPANTDLELYKKTLIERFANSAVSDQISRLCGDGASKFPVYVMPIVAEMLNAKAEMTRIAYLIAAYRHYLKYRIDDKGVGYELFEPTISEEDLALIVSAEPAKFLMIQPFAAVDLLLYPKFVDLYLSMVTSIEQIGAMKTLQTIK